MTSRIHISNNGTQYFIKNDKLHCLDGPAIVYSALACSEWPGFGQYSWYINDKQYYDNEEFQEAAKLSDEDMLAMILKYGNVE
jgi:hypothetical protein